MLVYMVYLLYLFSADVMCLEPKSRENIAHLLSTMHIVLRQQDGHECGSGQYGHITNTTYEKFVER